MPPEAWSRKDERQYKHILDSELESGRPEDRAKEIAARTVNDQRRKEGRTPNQTTQGTGNPTTSLESRTRDQLLNRARELGIAGRSSMRKSELINAIREQNR
jgi:phage terminase small subunit